MQIKTIIINGIGIVSLAFLLQSNSCNAKKEQEREAKKDSVSSGLLVDAEAELRAMHVRDSTEKALAAAAAQARQDSIAKADSINAAQNNFNNGRPHPPPLPLEPRYKTGQAGFDKFISGNLKMPAEAKAKKISGIVYVDCMIKADGTIIKPHVRTGLGYGCDEEALRLVKLMPAWEPGQVNGKPADMEYMIMIPFVQK
jgi:hypothetical protein